MFLLPTEGYLSNSVIPNDLSGALSDTLVLPVHNPRVKRMRVNGGFTSHHSKRAPHLLQADAVASVKRMRLAEPLPLAAFLSSDEHNVNADLSSMSAGSTFVQTLSSTVPKASDTVENGCLPGVAQGK